MTATAQPPAKATPQLSERLGATPASMGSLLAILILFFLATLGLAGCDNQTEFQDARDLADTSPDASSDAEVPPFRFLLIRDNGEPATASAERGVGVAIDAIYLRKGTAPDIYATTVHAEAFGQADEDTTHRDSSQALGAPNCDADEDAYVNLGGRGGLLVVSFDEDIEPGDGLVVLGCFPQGGLAAEGDYEGLVGQYGDPENSGFVPCLSDETGGDCVFELPAE